MSFIKVQITGCVPKINAYGRMHDDCYRVITLASRAGFGSMDEARRWAVEACKTFEGQGLDKAGPIQAKITAEEYIL